MSRKTTYSILASLLCLFPFLTQAQTLTQYEYWFDDDFGGRVIESMSGTDEAVRLSIKTDQLDNGVHKFSFRAKQSDGKYSAITSSLFLKRTAAQNSVLEYWFDDNFDQRDFMDIGKTEDEQDFDLDLRDNTKYPWGFHKLNMRITLEGGGESAVYSSPVLKLSAGTATSLEYWIDDDIAHSHTFEGHLASDGQDYLFVSDLDLGDISPGHHRLYCRAVSSSGKTTSAVTMTPIIVKSKYHVDDPSTLTVTRQAYWIDDEEPVEKPVPDPKELKNLVHPVNMRQLSEGQHTLHMQYANSAGLWSSVGDLTFTKEKTPDPVIQLTATEENGLVTLNYNTVPYGFEYDVARKYPSGKLRKVDTADDERFPLALKATDTPPSGTYTYFVRGHYHDEDGEVKDICSNEVTVTVTEPDNSVKRVNVNVRVVFDNGKTNIWKDDNLRVHFSDGSSKIPNGNGLITLNNIPVGTEMTMSIPFRAGCNYVADEKTFYVTENSPKQTIELLARENDERVTVTDASDLITQGEISTNPDSWYATIGNGTGKTWKGKVIMRMVSKSDFEEITSYFDRNVSPDEGSGIITPADIPNTKLFIQNMLTWNVAYQTDFSINKNGKVNHEMFMDFIALPHPNKNKMEDYYVFFSSLKEGDTQEKPMEGDNPKVLRINPREITQGEVDELENFCYYYAKVLKYFNNIKNWDDPVKLTWNSLKNGKKDIIDLANKSEVTAEEANRIMLKYMVDETGLTLIGLFGNSLKSKIKTAKQLKEMPDEVYNLITELQQYYDIRNAPPYHQFFKVANLIAKKTKTPFLETYSAYFTVGEAMAIKIEELENEVSERRMWQYFADGHVTCKLRVAYRDKKNNVSKYFNPEYVKEQIKSAKIEGFWRDNNTQPLSDNRKATWTNLGFSSGNDGNWLTINGGEYSQFKAPGLQPIGSEIWLVIEWQDGNVIRVPLLEKRVVERKESGFEGAGSVTFSVDLCSEFYQDKYMTKAIHFDEK